MESKYITYMKLIYNNSAQFCFISLQPSKNCAGEFLQAEHETGRIYANTRGCRTFKKRQFCLWGRKNFCRLFCKFSEADSYMRVLVFYSGMRECSYILNLMIPLCPHLYRMHVNSLNIKHFSKEPLINTLINDA